MFSMWGQPIEYILIELAVKLFIIAAILPLHEMAHGVVANWLGDPTAKMSGRLTLNPLAHLDIMGTLCIIFFGFGWAKPVPVNPYNFKNRKTGMALTALAGPMSNIIAAFVGILLQTIVLAIVPDVSVIVTFIFQMYITVNLSLAVFNLIPLPPLDGSRILGLLIPDRYLQAFYQYERYIMIVVLLLVFSGVLSVPLSFLTELINNGLTWLATAIVGIFQ